MSRRRFVMRCTEDGFETDVFAAVRRPGGAVAWTSELAPASRQIAEHLAHAHGAHDGPCDYAVVPLDPPLEGVS